MIPSSNWKMTLTLEKRILGQSVLLFDIRSESVMGNANAQLAFCDLDWNELMKSLGKIGKEIRDTGNLAASDRLLVGTGTGPLTQEMFPVTCEKPFGASDLRNVSGYVDGFSWGFGFGKCKFTVVADGFFSCEIEGVTASMMPYQKGKVDGKWLYLSGVTGELPTRDGNAPISQSVRATV